MVDKYFRYFYEKIAAKIFKKQSNLVALHYLSIEQYVWLTKRNFLFKKMGQSFSSFLFIFVLFSSHFQQFKLKKCRWCAWDSNPWLQNGRRRRNHGATVAAQSDYLFFKNGPTPASSSLIFGLFKQTLQIFTKNICEKMSIQCTVPGFELMIFGT